MRHLEPEQLALAALKEDVGEEASTHLEACAQCRSELDALRRVVDAARSDDPDMVAPPPRVWESVAAETGVAPSLPTPNTRPTSLQATAPPYRTHRRSITWLAAAAAFFLGVTGTALIDRMIGDELEAPARSTVASAALQPVASGDPRGTARIVERDNRRTLVLNLSPTDSPDAAGFREVWLLNADRGRLVSLGVLDDRSGSFMLPRDLRLADYPTVDVSFEPTDGDPAHSGESLARGQLSF